MRVIDLPIPVKCVRHPRAQKAEVISIFSAEDKRNARMKDQPMPCEAFGLSWAFTDHEPDPKGAA